MKQTPFLLFLLIPFALFSQDSTQSVKTEKGKKPEHHSIGIGIKAGLNFANITNASAINSGSETGFHAGIFLDPSHAILGSRTELLYSQQGYNYSTGQTTGKVKLGYLMLAQLMAINITKYVQLQIGGQTSYLLNAKADSSKASNPSTGNAQFDKLLDTYNRFDYGLAGGIEVRPVLGLLIGARYNLSLSNLYKQAFTAGGGSGGSGINPKNNVVQLFLGYRF